jgi:sulfatase maturation enzyme AslB (radical SAM superfamily)
MSEKIKISDTMCAFPWTHLHAWPEGRAMLCCLAHGGNNRGEVGDFSTHSFQEIMNSDKMKQVRRDLMNGIKIPECEVCWKNEELEKHSHRRGKNIEATMPLEFAELEALLKITHPDGTLENPKMLYMDFRFSNLCNLGCQTCGSPLSSTIANNRENNDSEEKFLKNKNVLSERGTVTSFVYARPDFMEVDVYPYLDDCREFYFAGGEPLMHQEHLDILKYLDANKLYDKKITYSSNMTLTQWKGTDFLEIWKNFNNIYFFCSIDGKGDALEFIREFSNHSNIFKNLDKLLKLKESDPKSFKVHICYTHSLYNAYYTKEFFQFLFDNGFLDRLDHIEINIAYDDENSPACLPSFAIEELRKKRAEDRQSDVMQYAFTKFHRLKHYFDAIDITLDDKIPSSVFDRLVQTKLKHKMGKIEKALPWLASVINRSRII